MVIWECGSLDAQAMDTQAMDTQVMDTQAMDTGNGRTERGWNADQALFGGACDDTNKGL